MYCTDSLVVACSSAVETLRLSSPTRDRTYVPPLQGRFFSTEPPGKEPTMLPTPTTLPFSHLASASLNYLSFQNFRYFHASGFKKSPSTQTINKFYGSLEAGVTKLGEGENVLPWHNLRSVSTRESQEFEGWISCRLVLGHKPEIGEHLQTRQVSQPVSGLRNPWVLWNQLVILSWNVWVWTSRCSNKQNLAVCWRPVSQSSSVLHNGR